MQSKIATDIIIDLAAVGEAKTTHFTVGHLLPHGHAALEQSKAMARAYAVRETQVEMGEASNKIGKANLNSVCTTAIFDGPRDVGGACSNTTTFTSVLTDCLVDSVDPAKVPFLQYASRVIAIFLTSNEYREFCEKKVDNSLAHYWVFNLFNRVVATFVKVLADEPSIRAAHTINGDTKVTNINHSYVKLAYTTLQKGLETLEAACAESGVLESVKVHISSPFSAESRAAAAEALAAKTKKNPLYPPLETKTPKKPKLSTPGSGKDQEKIVGAITVLIPKMIIPTNEVTWPKGQTPLCAPTLRDKSRGCQVKGICEFSHDPPAKWSPELWVVMKNMVDSHEYLRWNHQVATPELLGMTYNRSEKVKP